jgi:Holliday junction resolvase RusA-like endonuclease
LHTLAKCPKKIVSKKIARLWVSGAEPAPQGSKRYVGGNHASGGRFIEASKKLEPFRQAIGQAVIKHMAEIKDTTPFTEPVEVEAIFVLPKPKTVKRFWPSVAPDLDKLCRALGDSMSLERYCNGFPLVQDDALIVTWRAQKVYGEPHEMGVYFTVTEAGIPWHMDDGEMLQM